MNDLKKRIAARISHEKSIGYPTSALSLIGNTPMVNLSTVSARQDVTINAKLEGRNPGGSIKDRPALQMVLDGIESEQLVDGMGIIEATSGNTGTGLAFVGSVLGIPVTLVVPEVTSPAKLRDMRRFRAKIKVVHGDTTEHALEEAYKIRDRHPRRFWMPDQYTNPSNPKAHYLTTGPEILTQCPSVTHVVAAQGSFGTLAGLARRFSESKPGVRLHAVIARPGTTTIFGMKEADKVMPLADDSVLAGRFMVDGRSAAEGIQHGLRFGFQLGPSAGAVLAAAVKLSERLPAGSTIVCIFADFGTKYPGCPLYHPKILANSPGMDLDHAAFTRW